MTHPTPQEALRTRPNRATRYEETTVIAADDCVSISLFRPPTGLLWLRRWGDPGAFSRRHSRSS